MSSVTIVIDVIGAFFFISAAYFSYKNHLFIGDASNLWRYFFASSVIATCWIISLILQEIFMIPDSVESSLFFAVIFLFTLVAMASLFDFIKLQGNLHSE